MVNVDLVERADKLIADFYVQGSNVETGNLDLNLKYGSLFDSAKDSIRVVDTNLNLFNTPYFILKTQNAINRGVDMSFLTGKFQELPKNGWIEGGLEKYLEKYLSSDDIYEHLLLGESFFITKENSSAVICFVKSLAENKYSNLEKAPIFASLSKAFFSHNLIEKGYFFAKTAYVADKNNLDVALYVSKVVFQNGNYGTCFDMLEGMLENPKIKTFNKEEEIGGMFELVKSRLDF